MIRCGSVFKGAFLKHNMPHGPFTVLDLSRRLEVSGRDELTRLAESFNGTLDALERSVEAQRHLIADASHELRTPIASLRANIQVLGEAERLPAAEQESVRRDIIEELYLRCFGREPDPAELDLVLKRISESQDGRQAVLEDLFWALLNSEEFIFNH